MAFEHPYILYLLGAIPVLILSFLLYLRWRKLTMQKFGDPEIVKQLMDSPSPVRKWIKFSLLLSALICFIIGLANLRVGSKKEKVTGESAEIIICFDVSNSMLAEDVKPNRLAQSKFMVAQLIDKLAANKIGLIVFAGNSYVQMPLTHDARAALMYLDGITTGSVPTQGTAIGSAIETALQEFKEGGADDERKGRAIIIVTDGESHDENAVEMAKQAAAMQIKIITLGVGTSEGAPIPIRRNGMIDGFKKDRAGNVVLTRLNEPLMSNLAAEADGEYRNIAQGKQVISDVAEIIDGLDKTKDGEYAYSDYANHFQLFLGLGLLLLIIEYLLSDRKPDWVKKINLFEQHEN